MNGPEPVSKTTAEGPAAEKAKERPKKRKVFYYYALRFTYEFKYDDDSVYFAFAKPITYTDILSDLHRKEKLLIPKNQGAQKGVSKTKSQ